MSLLEEHQIDCPNCGENIEIVLDRSIIQQQYTEDCFVCCKPIVIKINFDSDFQKVTCINEAELF